MSSLTVTNQEFSLVPESQNPHPFGIPIRVLIADSNQMNSELLAGALTRNRTIEVVGSATGDSALRDAIAANKPQVLLISTDLEEGPGSGFKIMRELRASQSQIKLIALLDSSRRDRVVEAFWSGAQGVFSRSGSIKSLCKCISRVQSGQIWANTEEMRLVLEALTYAVPPRLVNANGTDLLTQREQDVVRCLAEGLSNREVAKRLKISEHTVKNYLFHIFDKLGVSSRVEVVLYASGQRMLVKKHADPEMEHHSLTDTQEILDSLLQGAKLGFPGSQFNLGCLYREGKACPADPVSAYVWFETARLTSEGMVAKSREARDRMAGSLTPQQLLEAKRRISMKTRPTS
jgi:DNA-binding NarL/FixJ family response regulator